MIVITGAQGFIGSTMVAYLNHIGITDLVAVDDFGIDQQKEYAYKVDYTNLQDCQFRSIYPISLDQSKILPKGDVQAVFHFGAITNTLEKDLTKIEYYNTAYTRILNQVCKNRKIPLIFSSTAAIYGNGNGPLNLYAKSKLQSEIEISDYAMCLRLFNVYGKKESKKGKMASVIFKWQEELKNTNSILLFENSIQYSRDFVFVEDVCRISYELLSVYTPGIYDVGTGISRSFETVADILISSIGNGKKNYIPIPENLKMQYQTNTRADTSNLKKLGIAPPTTTIEKVLSK